jgi:hypothetical protein
MSGEPHEERRHSSQQEHIKSSVADSCFWAAAKALTGTFLVTILFGTWCLRIVNSCQFELLQRADAIAMADAINSTASVVCLPMFV